MYKVLILEDEKMIRKGLRYTFDWLGSECVVVGEGADGREGLEKIDELKPDIVLVDIVMPVMDGITMLEKCNENENHTFSAIIISGYNEFDYAKQAIKLGVSEYLLKPVDQDELYQALERSKEQVRLRRQYNEIKKNYSTIDDIKVLDIDFYEHDFKTSNLVVEMLKYIQKTYHEKISIQDLIKPLDRSSTHLNQKFKEETNYTFNEFLNRYRIQKSIDLIKSGEEKICHIATAVGFSSYRYFIRVFKKYVNCLPSDFQEYFQNYGSGPNSAGMG